MRKSVDQNQPDRRFIAALASCLMLLLVAAQLLDPVASVTAAEPGVSPSTDPLTGWWPPFVPNVPVPAVPVAQADQEVLTIEAAECAPSFRNSVGIQFASRRHSCFPSGTHFRR